MVNPKDASKYREGETIGQRFTVLQYVGVGGTGQVYRVADEESGKTYALKTFFSSVIPSHIQAHQLKSFLGPLVPKADDVCQPRFFGEDRGRKYVVSDFVSGVSLRNFVDQRNVMGMRFTIHEGASILLAVAGIFAKLPTFTVHGNIKPENILLNGIELQLAKSRLPKETSGSLLRTSV